MANDSLDVTASDIDRLRAIIFPVSAARPRHHSLTSGYAQTDTRQSKRGNDYQTKDAAPHIDIESGLASIVQDSEEIINVDTISPERLKSLSPNAIEKSQAMASQNDAVDATQLISQSFYESILRKQRSERLEVQDDNSQRTYEEGDSGHVDITSSFVTHNEQAEDIVEDLADSEPIEFSPVQSQQPLTQFPESQRFKTPATAGKKRRYNGDVVDTPAPIRNPLVKDGKPTPDGMLGLSQAFAATQAASSPLSNGLPTGPRSDRPSPNIELQTRPATTTSSSPLLRPIGDLRRTVTEPASRYKPVKQSQAERERQERLHMLQNDFEPDTFDDEFDRQDSLIARQRRQQERKRETKEELKSLSSPILHGQEYQISSPSKPPMENQNAGRYTQSLPPASPMDLDQLDEDETTAATASEEETEQEDDPAVDVKQPSQAMRLDDEDKENDAILVPKTVLKRRFEMEEGVTQVDASPSLRYTTKVSTPPTEGGPHSSEPFRIMDSQCSQTRNGLRGPTRGTTTSTSDIIDFMQTSPEPTTSEQPEIAKNALREFIDQQTNPTAKPDISWPEDETGSEQQEEYTPTSHNRNTIPETASEVRKGNVSGHTENTSNQSASKTVTGFETAPTHFSASAGSQSLQTSSPIRTTPPGRKRRRMLEISAEPSPRKLRSEVSFNAESVLRLDEDQAAANLLQSSPPKTTKFAENLTSSHNTPTLRSRDATPKKMASRSPVESNRTGQIAQVQRLSNNATSEAEPAADMSQEVIKPGRHTRHSHAPLNVEIEVHSQRPLPPAVRQSVFDLSASPEDAFATAPVRENISRTRRVAKSKNSKSQAQSMSRMEQRLHPDNVTRSSEIATRGRKIGETKEVPQHEAETSVHDPIADMPSDVVIAPHMVLAYYKGEPRGYYPAEVLARTSSNGYRIQWEEYDPEEIDSYGVKALDLRVGDAIKILAKGFAKVPYIIQGFKDKITPPHMGITDVRGFQTLIVSQKQRKSLPADIKGSSKHEVPVAVIYLDVNMWAQMKSRNQEFTPTECSTTTSASSALVTPIRCASSPATPSSRSRRQMITTTSSGLPITRGMFSEMAFVISYDDTAQKNTLTSLVQTNGGLVIHESFYDLFDLDTIKIKSQYQNVGFTALLTERHSRKEKYMQALALGLPCISGKWIESSIKHNSLQDWSYYLLPAGESIELDNVTRSRILPDFIVEATKLSKMLKLRPNLLHNASVIVVVGRGKTEQKRTPYLFLIQGMGAGQIHKVPDVKSAKEFLDSEHGKEFKWIFVDDKDVEATKNMLVDTSGVQKPTGKPKKGNATKAQSQCRVAGNELIVQSLILGKLYEHS